MRLSNFSPSAFIYIGSDLCFNLFVYTVERMYMQRIFII